MTDRALGVGAKCCGGNCDLCAPEKKTKTDTKSETKKTETEEAK